MLLRTKRSILIACELRWQDNYQEVQDETSNKTKFKIYRPRQTLLYYRSKNETETVGNQDVNKNSAIAEMAAQCCAIRISAVECGILLVNALFLSSLREHQHNRNYVAEKCILRATFCRRQLTSDNVTWLVFKATECEITQIAAITPFN